MNKFYKFINTKLFLTSIFLFKFVVVAFENHQKKAIYIYKYI